MFGTDDFLAPVNTRRVAVTVVENSSPAQCDAHELQHHNHRLDEESLLAYLPLTELQRQHDEDAKELVTLEELLKSLEARRRTLRRSLGIINSSTATGEGKEIPPLQPKFLIPISEYHLEVASHNEGGTTTSSSDEDQESIVAMDFMRFHNARATKYFTIIGTSKGNLIIRDEDDGKVVGRKKLIGIREMRVGGQGDTGTHFIATVDQNGRVGFHPIHFSLKMEKNQGEPAYTLRFACAFSEVPTVEVLLLEPGEGAVKLLVHELGPRRTKLIIGSTQGRLHLIDVLGLFRRSKEEPISSSPLPSHQHQIINFTNVSLSLIASNHGGSLGLIAVLNPSANTVVFVNVMTGRQLVASPQFQQNACPVPRLLLPRSRPPQEEEEERVPRVTSLAFDLNVRDSARLLLGYDDGTIAVLDRRFSLRATHVGSTLDSRRGSSFKGILSFVNVFASVAKGSGGGGGGPVGCRLVTMRRARGSVRAILPLVGYHASVAAPNGVTVMRIAMVEASSAITALETDAMEMRSREEGGWVGASAIDTFEYGFGVAMIREDGKSGVLFRSAFPSEASNCAATPSSSPLPRLASSSSSSVPNGGEEYSAGAAYVAQIPLYLCAGIGLYILYSRGRLTMTPKLDLDEMIESRRQQKRFKEMQREGRVSFLPERRGGQPAESLRMLERLAEENSSVNDLLPPQQVEMEEMEEDQDEVDWNGDYVNGNNNSRFVTTNAEFLEEMRNTRDWAHPPY